MGFFSGLLIGFVVGTFVGHKYNAKIDEIILKIKSKF